MRTLLKVESSLEPPDGLRDLPAFYEKVIMAVPERQSGRSMNINIHTYLVPILRTCDEISRLSLTITWHGT